MVNYNHVGLYMTLCVYNNYYIIHQLHSCTLVLSITFRIQTPSDAHLFYVIIITEGSEVTNPAFIL